MTDQIETPEAAPKRASRAAKTTVTPPETTPDAPPRSIGEIIPLIRKELGAIAKDQQTTGPGNNYSFRGHDQIVNAIVPLFDKYGVWTTAKDELLRYDGRNAGNKYATHSVLSETVYFHAPDGSIAETTIVSESIDYSNKATGQAGTYAYRIALEKTFTIPTNQPDPDSTAEHFEATSEPEAPAAPEQPQAAAPSDDEIKALKDQIADSYKAIDIVGKEAVLAHGNHFFNGREGWNKNKAALNKLLKAIQAGDEKAIGDLPVTESEEKN